MPLSWPTKGKLYPFAPETSKKLFLKDEPLEGKLAVPAGEPGSTAERRPSAHDLEIEFSDKLQHFDPAGVMQAIGYTEESLTEGLTEAQAKINLEKFGPNRFPEPPPANFCRLFLGTFEDPALIVLLMAATVQLAIFILGKFVPALHSGEDSDVEWLDAVMIFAAVACVSLVSSVSDYQKELQFAALNAQKNEIPVSCKRDGQIVMLQGEEGSKRMGIYELVVGDLVELAQGDQIPADGIIIRSDELTVSEASLTGESDPLNKNPSPIPDYVYMNTFVTTGKGVMVVLATGPNTMHGSISDALQEEPEQTPLQEKLNRVVTLIGYIGMLFALMTLVAYYSFCFQNNETRSQCTNGHPEAAATIVLRGFIAAVTIVVVAIPEGLPLAVTIALAYSQKQMMKENNLVRKLEACETMGGATQICSDKTGTLTQNVMVVDRGFLVGDNYDMLPQFDDLLPTGGCNTTHNFGTLKCSDEMKYLLAESIVFNSTCNVSYSTISSGSGGATRLAQTYDGSASECALVSLVQQYGPVNFGADHADLLNLNWEAKTSFVSAMRRSLEAMPDVKFNVFDSKKKRSSVLFPTGGKDGKVRVHTKGAAEQVVKLCGSIITSDGSSIPMDDVKMAELNAQIKTMAMSGLRTFCAAYADIDSKDAWNDDAEDPLGSPGLTMLALVGIKDPVRPEVPGAVEQCKKAGIVVRMVTGDNIDTAKNIARQCKIYNPADTGGRDIAMEGYEFRSHFTEAKVDGKTVFNYDKSKVYGWVNDLTVLARSVPRDKEILVRVLQDLDNVVAATGDGTNDAPALHRANVGLAMGITGTDIAKQAADVIIMDDRFSSIVEAVKWGRNIYHNIRKFLQFQLTVNVVALLLTFLAAAGGEMPLTALQLLWVNLIMDTMGALALATEQPDREKLLADKPHGKSALLSPEMIRNIGCQSVYQMIILLIMLWGPETFCPAGTNTTDVGTPTSDCYMLKGRNPDGSSGYGTVKTTMIFNTFVWMQVFNEFNARQIGSDPNIFSGLLTSKYFGGVFVFTSVIQFLLVQYCGIAVHTVPLDLNQWLICVGFGVGAIVVGVLMRFVPIPSFLKVDPNQEKAGAAGVSARSLRRPSSSHSGRRLSIQKSGLEKSGSKSGMEMTKLKEEPDEAAAQI